MIISIGHSHNDIGSYAITINGTMPYLTGDPGSPGMYDYNSFSSARFTQAIFNSYGHPVPLVAGQNQTNAALAQNQPTTHSVPTFNFTTNGDTSETLTINMTAAYPSASSLLGLYRSFTYTRVSTSLQTVGINDTVSFSSPQAFEVPLVTLVNWTAFSNGTGGCFQGKTNAMLCATVSASQSFSLIPRLLIVDSNPSKTYTRIAISLSTTTTSAWVYSLFYKP